MIETPKTQNLIEPKDTTPCFQVKRLVSHDGRELCLSTKEPNFSIVSPTGCNAKCGFCFWSKGPSAPKSQFLDNLRRAFDGLPRAFRQCSITGGEPTTLPWLQEILESAHDKFGKVVVSSNGHSAATLDFGNIDHLNISRHHHEDGLNSAVFGTKTIPSTEELAKICRIANSRGVDVTLNCVLRAGFSDCDFILRYVDFSKKVGANAICFRKEHSDVEMLPVEQMISSHPIEESKCPACVSRVVGISGVRTTWKYSVAEPSAVMNGVYELIFNQDGKVYADWAATEQVSISG